MSTEVDLTPPQSIHIVGVGGAGMSAIASVLAAMGHRVSGSDLKGSKALDRLAEHGLRVAVGHRADQLGDAAVLARSTAIGDGNPEVVAAREQGLPVLRRSEVLAAITDLRRTISVAGTHGKTTTSSMLAVVLAEAGLDPSFIIGGDVHQIGSGAVWSEGDWFVVEADESDGTFVELTTEVAVVTNVEADHHAHYGGFDALRDAFDQFVEGASRLAVVGIDDEEGAALAARHPGESLVTVGEDASATYRIGDLVRSPRGTTFRLVRRGEDLGEVHLPIPGAHNARNAAVAAATAIEVGASFSATAAALARFGGVARRFEFRGEKAGIAFVDDYAHLPTEVAAALATGRDTDPDRLVAVFQPHRYTRVHALADEFGSAFSDADLVVVTDVYSAGETPIPGVSGMAVVTAIHRDDPERQVEYLPRREDLVSSLVTRLRAGDLCLTLGAGDLTTLPDELQAALSLRPRGVSAIDRLADRLADGLGAGLGRDVALGPFTTYRVGGPAALFVEVDTEADLAVVAAALAAEPDAVPVLVVGKGSNLLVADAGFPGFALRLGGAFTEVAVDGLEVRAGGGAPLPVLARQTAAAGLTGLEWAVGVPGTVGGGVRMNAGGHGSDIAATLVEVRLLDLRTGEDGAVSAAGLQLGYRRSSVEPHQVVLHASFHLEAGDAATATAEINEIVRWRRENQPGGPNAGSVFTNPEGDSAGRLIEAAGAKGRRLGTAQVSPKHANFIQADPGGRADDVVALMAEVRELVRESSGVELEAETRLVGFDPGEAS